MLKTINKSARLQQNITIIVEKICAYIIGGSVDEGFSIKLRKFIFKVSAF